MHASDAPVPLRAASLRAVAPGVSVPTYDRAALRRSIVHLGVGGFHRSHLAVYVDELCREGRTDWAIVGSGMLERDRSVAEALAAQDHLYSLVTRDAGGSSVAVIGSIVDYVLAVESEGALVGRIADPDTQIVSLTVTEGGYPVDDVTGAHDRDQPAGPFAVIVAGLAARMRSGARPLTILSCDNIVHNGAVTRAATLGVAEAHGPELVRWIDRHVAFPSSMVDRITPATTPQDRAWLAETHGLDDRSPVVTEPFRQWVVEDAFAGDRPPLEHLDVTVTTDVEPYEAMKLRMLNGAHSCLAYLASLADVDTVDVAMADPDLGAYVRGVIRFEAMPVVPPVPGIDLDRYAEQLAERFANPAIADQIARLCLDGSAKFPKFLLPTIRDQLAIGGPIDLSVLALAGWAEYLRRDQGLAADPLLDLAVDHARRAEKDPIEFLGFREVFGDDLPRSPRFVERFISSSRLMRSAGVRSAIQSALREVGRADGGSGR